MESLMHQCTDSINHVNSTIEQNKEGHDAGCLDIMYIKLRENVTQDSDPLPGDDIAKRKMTINN